MDRAWEARREGLSADETEAAELFEEAKSDLDAAIATCRDEGRDPELAEALHRLANLERDLGNRDRAEVLWTESVEICRGIDRPLMLAHKVRHLADLRLEQNRLEAARKLYEEAMAIYRDPANAAAFDHANAAMAYAGLAEKLADAELALGLWREAGEHYAAIRLDEGVDVCAEQIRSLNSRLGN